LRVTVGMPDENTPLLAALQTLLVKIEAKA
jgi:histidinol-phosphate/aromatic aminotransferase/cobyric acid decarboxylase-like protein